MFEVALLILMQSPNAARSAEVAERLLRARAGAEATPAHERKTRARNFEAKFNALVTALELFSKSYNEARGELWPEREAKDLRKALQELTRLTDSRQAQATCEVKP